MVRGSFRFGGGGFGRANRRVDRLNRLRGVAAGRTGAIGSERIVVFRDVDLRAAGA